MRGNASDSGWASLFRLAFERSSNPMALLRSNGEIVAVNAAFQDSFGYSGEQLIGRQFDLVAPPEARDQMKTEWRELKPGRSIVADREAVHADGRRVRVQFAAQLTRVNGRDVVLAVQLDRRLRPTKIETPGGGSGERLTPRELQIVAGIAMGQRTNEIARDLFIAPSTVRTHKRNAMAKVGARSQAQLVAIALTTGMLDPERCRELAEERSR